MPDRPGRRHVTDEGGAPLGVRHRAVVLLITKFALLKVVRSGRQFLPLAGILLFFAFVAVWATSVADYVSAR